MQQTYPSNCWVIRHMVLIWHSFLFPHIKNNLRGQRFTPTDSPLGRELTRNIGPNVRICQLNIEVLSIAKCQHLRRIVIENQVDVVALQETHVENESPLCLEARFRGMT